MRSGGGPARFSITEFFFWGGRDRFAFVVVVLISLTFDVKKRGRRMDTSVRFGEEANQVYFLWNGALGEGK